MRLLWRAQLVHRYAQEEAPDLDINQTLARRLPYPLAGLLRGVIYLAGGSEGADCGTCGISVGILA